MKHEGANRNGGRIADTVTVGRRWLFSVVALATVAVPPTASRAADCPAELGAGHAVRLVDDRGRIAVVATTNGQYVRRSESVQSPKGPASNHSDAYLGLFTETTTTQNDGYTRVQFNKLDNDGFDRLKTFLPLKVGTSLTLDTESILLGDTASPAPPQFVQPNQLVRTVIKILRSAVVTLGTCAYKTVVIEMNSGSPGGADSVVATYNYSPELKTWLTLHLVAKTSGQPDTEIDRSIVSIAAEK